MTRVRFAPSPTGNLHIGTLRTALFSWLYSKSVNGQFILRIEDTDLERSSSDYEISILDGLAWMGLTTDEGPVQQGKHAPYRQSERIEQGIYQQYAMSLVWSGDAYYCFDTTEELEAERNNAIREGRPYVYSRKSLKLTPEEVQSKLDSGVPYTIRFKMPDSGTLTYTDLIRGDVTFDLGLVGDFVILKSDKSPAYNFAVVVDDVSMEISHVIRGEDHISNMPKQLCLFDALGKKWPQFAHMPMILGTDKSKLSKRHGATNVTDYRDQGFLSDALFNYLALLGWSPEGEQEILSRYMIQSQFSLKRISKSNAVFDIVKLKWMNGQYIRQLSKEALYQHCLSYLSESERQQLQKYSLDQAVNAVYSIRDNLETLDQVGQYLQIYISTDSDYQEQLETIQWSEVDHQVLSHLQSQFEQSHAWEIEHLSSLLDDTMSTLSIGKGKVLKPLRLAITAQKSGPYIVDIIHVFGKEKTLQRIADVLK